MKRLLWISLLIAVLALAGSWWLRHRRQALPAAEDPAIARVLQDPALIAKGRYLATAGDCVACHTARGGQAFAGGRMLPTPFGSIPAPNLTPDNETGIGSWTFRDFWRALHEGVGRQGELLYPAFSYTSFTRVTHGDALAIYAYLRSLQPVHQADAPLGLRFPYDMRGTLAAWRALYFKPGVYQADTARPASWNRGAYLVEGLAHCNECHAARDAWGGQQGGAALSGGRMPAQDWYAPDLSTQANGGLQGWDRQDIVDLLKTGQSSKGIAVGPMADVVESSTQYLRDDDLQAIADYLLALPPRSAPAPSPASQIQPSQAERGRLVYTEHCQNCHGKDGMGVSGVYPPLDGNVSVVEAGGVNATRVVLLGGFAPVTARHPRPYSMPPYAQQLSDADVAAVVTYIRQAWSNSASAIQERDVAAYRHTPVD